MVTVRERVGSGKIFTSYKIAYLLAYYLLLAIIHVDDIPFFFLYIVYIIRVYCVNNWKTLPEPLSLCGYIKIFQLNEINFNRNIPSPKSQTILSLSRWYVRANLLQWLRVREICTFHYTSTLEYRGYCNPFPYALSLIVVAICRRYDSQISVGACIFRGERDLRRFFKRPAMCIWVSIVSV